MRFQWDTKKAQSNARKHDVPFSDAVGVFEDARFVTVGLDFAGRVLVVCWTARGDDIRVVSARKATPRERATYDQGE
ncbi:MAG TPA: BrnT family toxin [Kofleriaceae bacterium]|nr:BrnT family toxin [Kofleriaceae bacterium]